MRTLILFISLIFLPQAAHSAAVIQKAEQQQQSQAHPYSSQQAAKQNFPNRSKKKMAPRVFEPVSETIDIVEVWQELDYSSEIWPLIMDRKPKEITIQEYIKLYRERGIKIKKPASHYVDFIDDMLTSRPDLIKTPFKNVLRFAAIVEYDFDNGIDRDKLALQLLGQQVYEENKKRLGR